MSKGIPQKQKPNRIVAGKAKRYENQIRERSSVWLERMPVTHEVASSSLVVPAILRGFQALFFSAKIFVCNLWVIGQIKLVSIVCNLKINSTSVMV